MPQTRLVFYRELDGSSPAWDWLGKLRTDNPRAYAKCVVRLQRLAQLGHELRRPEADFLRDDIYELRARFGTVNYRLLYFFQGRDTAVVAHGLTKEGAIPATEINRAIARKHRFIGNPKAHTYEGELDDT